MPLTPPQPSNTSPSPAAVNRPMVFGIVAMTLMMMTIDSTIVSTALDTLQTELDTDITWVGWTVTAYMFGFILMLPVAGRWSERYGRRRVFLGSMAMFTLASLLCGLTSNIYVDRKSTRLNSSHVATS